jgi:exopolysaccharide biosynthesis polyprenyl glycosylphosphotransferase
MARVAASPDPATGQHVEPSEPEDEHEPATRPVLPGTEWLVQRLHKPLTTLWAHGFRFLFVLDAVALFAIMVLINVARFGTDWPTYDVSFYMVGFSIATAIHLVINYFVGLYEREPRLGPRPWLGRTMLATAIGVAVQGLAFVVLDRYLMPRLNLVLFGLCASVVLAGNRHVSRFLATRRHGPPRVVLVGPPSDIELANRHLADSDRGAVVVGQASSVDGLRRLIAERRATDVLLLDVDAFGAIFPEPLSSLEPEGIGFLQRVSARETLLGLQNVRQVAGMPFVRLQVHTVPGHKLVFKRLFDLVLVVALAPVWLLACGLIALYVLLRAGRPVLYRQARVGRDGRIFRVVKFRTMVPDAEATGVQLATRDDPRVVPALAWMRATRADELPQLFNVLRGEMSLVGPRPERPELVASIANRVPGYIRRHELPPGLTGLAQVHGHYATDAEFKLGYDLQYLVNWSPILDVQILAKTVWVVVSRRV